MSDASSRRGWMVVLGVIVLVGGLIGAGALWYAGGQRLDDNVAGFARAPSGCATTLHFERTGRFTLYVETTGSLDALEGDCSADSEYARGPVGDPQVELVDPDGATVEISESDTVSYDTNAAAGSSIGVVEIDVTGDHVLTVAADGDQFAIAVGGDPNDGVGLLRWSAAALAIVALVAGGILLVLGSRRPEDASSAESPWVPDAATPTWPIGPPGFPAPPPTTGAAGPSGPPLLPAPGSTPAAPAPGPTVPGSTVAPPAWGPPSISNDA
jgi:hypothetical protein